MNQLEFREQLHDLLNKAAKTLCAEHIAFPLMDAAGGISVLASTINRSSLDDTLEIMRHRLDVAAASARVYYAAN